MKAIILKCAGLTGLNFELMAAYVNQIYLQDLIMMFWIKKGSAYIVYPTNVMLSIPLTLLKFVWLLHIVTVVIWSLLKLVEYIYVEK